MNPQISGYRITTQLYESAQSLIYRAQRESDGNPVVLKMLQDDYPTLERIAQFQREYEVTRHLRLPGVITAYALKSLERRWVMVLEDFGGDSLALLHLAGKIPLAEALMVAIKIAEILGQIHQQHVIHKDVNPSNIILNRATGQVKIIDFGISTALPHENPAFQHPNLLEGTLAYISPVSVGIWTLILNIPLIILAWWKLGFHPLAKTIITTLLLSGFIELFVRILPPYSNNILLASVLGGVLCGIGMGVIFVRGATTGGTDLISLLLNRVFPNISVGSLLLIVDALVVVFAVCVFRNIEAALYSIVTIFVTSRTIDAIMQGVDHAKVIYIVTERGDDILALLADELGRGVTVLQGRGGYTRRDKHMLVLVVRRNSFSQTLKTVKQIDKEAFIFVTDATEVHGEGFKPME